MSTHNFSSLAERRYIYAVVQKLKKLVSELPNYPDNLQHILLIESQVIKLKKELES